MTGRDDDRFLDEAVARGFLTKERADDVRRIAAALEEVEVALPVDEILARKAYLPRERCAELRRALARQRVGQYEVIERLGEGGSGVVWKARDVVLDRIVALKLLSPEARDDAAWRERFLREARTAVTLNHQGLVRGLDCGESDGYLWFAMEYVAGETLAARLRREGRLPERDALRIAVEVVGVLRYVAGLGIVHRDLKPDNLIVTADGRVKVCDLGLAKPTRESAERAGAGSLLAGTPLYVAPEQIRDGDRVDWRADVYSLGATLYHLLAGRPPFPWERGTDLLQRHLTEIPQSPREFALDVSPGAAAVVLRMLQKEPADRYARLEDLEEDLASVLAGRPPLHTASYAMERRPATGPAVARSRGGAGQRRAATAAALVLSALAGAVAWVVMSPTEDRTHRDAGGGPAASPTAQPDVPPPRAPLTVAPVVPDPPAGDTAAEAAARRALETARGIAAERPDDVQARLDAFRFVAERHPGTAAAGIAAGVVRTLEREIATRDAARLQDVRAAAGKAEGEGRLGAALRLWDEAANAMAGTPPGEIAQAEARRLREAADQRLRGLLDGVRDATAAREFTDARNRLREADRLGLPWAEREIATRRRDVDAAESAWVADRAASKPAFERMWGTAVLRFGDADVEAALAAIDAASRGELLVWAGEFDDLRIELLAAARAGPDPPRAAHPLDLRASFFARLARRDLSGAEALVPSLVASGGTADDLRDMVARVRGVLFATADELLVLAEQARAAGRPVDAGRFIDRAFAEAPGYPRARVAAAALRADRGHAEAALQELRKIAALAAPPPEVHLRIGQILATRRETLDEAQGEIELFLSLVRDGDPMRAEARAAKESILEKRAGARIQELVAAMNAAKTRGDDGGIVSAGEALLTLGGADWRALLLLGDAYSDLDRPHDAYLTYRRVLDARPYEREWPKAAAAIKRLEQRFTTLPQERDAVAGARSLLESGQLAAAREEFTTVVRRAPFFEDALAGAAEAWLERRGGGSYGVRDYPATALRLLEILAARNPGHLRGNELRAEALRRTGQFRAALELAVSCIPLDQVRPDPATTAGFAALQLEDEAAALGHFQTALDRRRTHRALYGRALAWEKLGHRAAARDEATMLIQEFGVPPEWEEEVRALLDRLDLEAAEGTK